MGETALGAVNVAMPFTMIVMAIGMLTSIGGAVVAAISIGEGDMEHANSTFFHSFSVTVVVAVIVMLTGTLLSEPLAGFLGADTAHKALTMEYLFWWSLCNGLITDCQHADRVGHFLTGRRKRKSDRLNYRCF